MSNYWYVDDVTGEQKINSGGAPLSPEQQIGFFEIVDNPPAHQFMYWHFVNEEWYWNKPGLKKAATYKRSQTQDSLTFEWNSQSYPVNQFMFSPWPSQMATAVIELPTDERTVYFANTDEQQVLTNAQVIEVVKAAWDRYQQNLDVCQEVIDLIDAEEVEDIDELDIAWDDANENYEVTRELNDIATALAAKANTSHGHDISDTTGLQTALDSKQGTITAAAHINDGATDAATNAPTNLNILNLLAVDTEINATNARYNDLATKYNDLSTKFNTLLAHLETQGLQLTS